MTIFTTCACRRGFAKGMIGALAATACADLVVGPAEGNSNVRAPGDELSTKSRVIDTGADLLQSKAPIDAMSVYLNGFHFYADDMGRQVEAHHYCTHLTEDLHQCVIYDGDDKNARLIGIEYIVSAKLFATLPEEEKKLWHSHDYEIKSGALVIPGVPEPIERSAFKDLVSTYGKTWHTWQVDRGDALPLGAPQLMMGMTDDGQLSPALLKRRDERLKISSQDRRMKRQEIPQPTLDPLANSWKRGGSLQTRIEQVELKNKR